jgi:uncharacterized membrane protein
MKHKKKLELVEKGWSDSEIKNAENVLERSESQDIYFSKMVFWSALLVIIIGNIVVSLILIPFLIVLDKVILYSLVIVLGGVIGFLYNFLITDIGLLEKKHHRLASIIIPLLALANMIMMVVLSNQFIEELAVKTNPHNPWVTALVFAGAFILPYIIDQIRLYLQGSRKAVIV